MNRLSSLAAKVSAGLALLALASCGSVQVRTAPQVSAPEQSMAGHDMATTSASASASPAAIATGEPSNGPAADATLPALESGTVHTIKLTAKPANQEIAPGVMYAAWTFDGHAPGPVIHVRQGDTINFTLKNDDKMPHSIDFHAAQTPWNLNYKGINPGESLSFTWKADYPGVFMYHCGTAPALMHIADGMYGAIVVEPKGGLPPAREYVLVQSEFYAKASADGKINEGDYSKMLNKTPDFVVFNGTANQYVQHPLTANPGERIRLWVVDAGPNDASAFHVVGAIFDKAYPDGNPANAMTGVQTLNIPPGGGAMVELTIPDEGLYPIVTHSFSDASKGATAMIKVGNPPMPAGGAVH